MTNNSYFASDFSTSKRGGKTTNNFLLFNAFTSSVLYGNTGGGDVRCLNTYQFVSGFVQTIYYVESSGELLEEFVVEAEESWLASERSFLVHPSVLEQNSHLQDVRANFSCLDLRKKLT